MKEEEENEERQKERKTERKRKQTNIFSVTKGKETEKQTSK